MYKAQVEPNIIFAAETRFDSSVDSQNQIRKLRLSFALFIPGLHSRSLKALPLADLGLLPMKSRRIQLAPDSTPT